MSVVVCHRDFLVQRCQQRGVPLEKALESVVATNGDILSIDTSHPSYPALAVGQRKTRSAPPAEPPQVAATEPAHGARPGTELKKLLARIGITSKPTCSCNARARLMDEKEASEPGWCEKNLDTIVGWLREESTKRGLPFVDIAARLLVRRAIANARKAEAARARESQKPPLTQ